MGKSKRGTWGGRSQKERKKMKGLIKASKREASICTNGIFNLSSRVLNEHETKALGKGLKFAPSAKVDKFGVFVDLKKFQRKMCLKKFFLKNPTEREVISSEFTHSGLKEGSSFFPRNMISEEMRIFEYMVMADINRIHSRKLQSNLTKNERDALTNLKNDPTIIIKSADKGGGIVIMDKELYDQEALRQLNDNTTYRLLPSNPTQNIKIGLSNLLTKGSDAGILDQKELKYLNPLFPKIPIFYLLPKIHKDPLHPPGRPIISGIQSVTSHLSQYLDILLQPLVKLIPSYLKDTMSLLQILENFKWEPDFFLVTCDVQSLYSIISHNKGCEAVRHHLNLHQIYPLEQVEFILEGIEFILRNNYFSFNNQFYLQCMGTAMGTRFAPSYANLFMAYWESQWSGVSCGWAHNLILYRRYIDDLLFIWKGDEESLKRFHGLLNQNDWGIKLDLQYSRHTINFLDLTLYIEGGTVKSKTYFKPVDVNNYIESTSCHAPAWLKSVPKSQLTRLRRNCTEREIFDLQANKLIGDLKEKGYKEESLIDIMKDVQGKDRRALIQYRKREEKENFSLPFIYNYNSHTPAINYSIRKYWHILKKDPVLQDILDDNPKIVNRGARTIKQQVVRSHVRQVNSVFKTITVKEGFYRCGSCSACKKLGLKREFCPAFGANNMFKIKKVISCHSTNVIYA
uniref:Reverse transcriptase domain-containing protein n=1 Tax=Leptobrachium leishanense TaxID=445787 RepID=A0A8C5M2E7_9ANUR